MDGGKLAHVGEAGRARRVDVSGKPPMLRTAVAGAALTLYDMCKAIDATMRISEICLVEKRKEPIGPVSVGQH